MEWMVYGGQPTYSITRLGLCYRGLSTREFVIGTPQFVIGIRVLEGLSLSRDCGTCLSVDARFSGSQKLALGIYLLHFIFKIIKESLSILLGSVEYEYVYF